MKQVQRMKAYAADIELLIEVAGRLGYLPRPEAVKRVASQRGLDPQSVSGRVTRASRDPLALLKLAAYHAQHAPNPNPAQRRINDVVDAGRKVIDEHRQRVRAAFKGKLATAVFISDIHFPAADFEALALVYKVLDHLKPVWVSALNDALDLPKMSKHVDARRLSDQAFDTDVSNSIQMLVQHTHALSLINPAMVQVAIGANHDARLLYRSAETGAVLVGDTVVADAMEQLAEAGVTFEHPLPHENVFRVNDGLVWLHGMTAAANPISRAVNNFKYVQRELGDSIVSTVSGHVHKQNVTRHPTLPSVVAYESGKLCRDDMAYLRHGADWTTGIVVSHFDPSGAYHVTTPVQFTKTHERWTCVLDGKTFSS